LLLHHHPFNYPFPTIGREISLLEEGSELVDIAGNSGFHIVCHGHRHHPRAKNVLENGWKNPITFVCSGSFSVNAQHRGNGDIPNCFHIIELLDVTEKFVTLKNFEYRPSEGWKEFSSFSNETPLDANMFFCKPYDAKTRKEILDQLIDKSELESNFELPEWDVLPVELKTLPYHSLNKLINEKSSEGYYIYGEYPKRVAVWRDKIE
jgi:hypothetical protein